MAVDEGEEQGGGLAFLNRLKPQQRLLLALIIVVLGVAIGYGVGSMSGGGGAQDKYVQILSKMNPKETATVVTTLEELKIEHQIRDEGTAIAVVREKVDEARLALASKGLPKDGVLGYELFGDKLGFMSTDFEKKVSLQRALNGELTRLVRQFDGVEDARVNLVVPEQALFAEQQLPPTASIMIKFASKGGFKPEQVESITYLVASSVQGLTPNNVTVVDTDGRLLSSGQGGLGDKALDKQMTKEMQKQLEVKRDWEQELAAKTQALLEKVVGPGHAKVEVNLDLDWKRQQMRERNLTPVVTQDQQLVATAKKTMTEQVSGGATPPGGAPGTTTNVPQAPGYAAAPGGTGGPTNMNKTQTQEQFPLNNQEVLTTAPTGAIKRITATALVQIDPETQPITKEQATSIVKTALGIDATRNDQVTVEVVNFDTSVSDKLREEMEKAAKEGPPTLWIVLAAIGGLVIGAGVAGALVKRKQPPPQGADAFGALAGGGAPGIGAAPIPGVIPSSAPMAGLPGHGGAPAEMPQDRVEISRAPAVAAPAQENPFAFLYGVTPETVAELLNSERLPTLVAVLAQLEPEQAEAVVNLLQPEVQKEVRARLETNPVLPPMTQKMVSQSLKKRLASLTADIHG